MEITNPIYIEFFKLDQVKYNQPQLDVINFCISYFDRFDDEQKIEKLTDIKRKLSASLGNSDVLLQVWRYVRIRLAEEQIQNNTQIEQPKPVEETLQIEEPLPIEEPITE